MNARITDALRWYADRSNYPDGVAGLVGVVGTPIMNDVGYKARAALTASDEAGTRREDVAAEEGSGIYMASKTTHARSWRTLRAKGQPIISTWIDEAGVGETADFTDLWRRCILEASTAERLIVYREPGEVLKGAFVEVGAALASGVPVFAIGCDEFSFTNHRLVTKCATLADALAAAPTPLGTEAVGGTLDVILAWYGTLPPAAKQRLSLANLHSLARTINGRAKS